MRTHNFVLLLYIFAFIVSNISAAAQQLVVKSAEYDAKDLFASIHPVLDKKKRPCALLRITIPSTKGVSFDEEVVQSSYENGEYLVYVPAGTKRLTISHPNYETLKIKLKDYNLSLEQKCAYSILIAPDESVRQITIVDGKKSQYVSIHISPSKASVTINEEKLQAKRGQVTKLLPVGSYSYQVKAKDYHDYEGAFTLEKKGSLVAIDIKLKPTFGWLSLDSNQESDSAEVFLDGNRIGFLPLWRSDRIYSGKHQISIKKDFYNSFEKTIEINEGKVLKMPIELERNFSFVTISAESDVEIWLNDSLLSIGTWSGKLLTGDYQIEGRKDRYYTSSMQKKVKVEPNQIVWKIPQLKPYVNNHNWRIYSGESREWQEDTFSIEWPEYLETGSIDSLQTALNMALFSQFTTNLLSAAESVCLYPIIEDFPANITSQNYPYYFIHVSEYYVKLLELQDRFISFECSSTKKHSGDEYDDIIKTYKYVNFRLADNHCLSFDEIFTSKELVKEMIETHSQSEEVIDYDDIVDFGLKNKSVTFYLGKLGIQKEYNLIEIPITELYSCLTPLGRELY